MNIDQAIDFIHGAQYTGKKNGLENTRALLDEISVPYTPVPAIHVAGTNGKGSVCAMLNGMLTALGYRVGLYTSPFLQNYQERIMLQGKPAQDELIISGVEAVQAAARRLHKKGIDVTTFEIGTALAYWVFYTQKVDVAIIEVGLGGKFDSTNVMTPKVSVITTIDYDHMEILGNTLGEIAWAKAGIIKKQVPVVVHPQNSKEAMDVISKTAKEKQAPTTFLTQNQIQKANYQKDYMTADFYLDPCQPYFFKVPLAGAYQGENALTALAALRLFIEQDFEKVYNKVHEGLTKVLWPGRLEYVYQKGHTFLLEGAHNIQGLKGLKAHLKAYAPAETLLLLGMLKDKVNKDVVAEIKAMDWPVITVPVNSPRALDPVELQHLLENQGVKVLQRAKGLDQAITKGKAYITTKEQGLIVIAGSLYLVGEARKYLHLPHQVYQSDGPKGD